MELPHKDRIVFAQGAFAIIDMHEVCSRRSAAWFFFLPAASETT